jgi:hypothetical protein
MGGIPNIDGYKVLHHDVMVITYIYYELHTLLGVWLCFVEDLVWG